MTHFFLLAGPYTSTNPQWRSITTSESALTAYKHGLRNYVAIFTTLCNYLRLCDYVPNVFTTLRLRNYCSAFTSFFGFASDLSSCGLAFELEAACPQLLSLGRVSATAFEGLRVRTCVFTPQLRCAF